MATFAMHIAYHPRRTLIFKTCKEYVHTKLGKSGHVTHFCQLPLQMLIYFSIANAAGTVNLINTLLQAVMGVINVDT